jgi:hypothetical protein
VGFEPTIERSLNPNLLAIFEVGEKARDHSLLC